MCSFTHQNTSSEHVQCVRNAERRVTQFFTGEQWEGVGVESPHLSDSTRAISSVFHSLVMQPSDMMIKSKAISYELVHFFPFLIHNPLHLVPQDPVFRGL